eukprot:GSA25T00012195001.1
MIGFGISSNRSSYEKSVGRSVGLECILTSDLPTPLPSVRFWKRAVNSRLIIKHVACSLEKTRSVTLSY